MRESCLLYRKEGAHFIAARTDDADRCREEQHEEIPSHSEEKTCGDHQPGTDREHAAAAISVRVRGQEQRDRCISNERECEQQAGLWLTQSQCLQVKDEDDGDRAIGKKPLEAS